MKNIAIASLLIILTVFISGCVDSITIDLRDKSNNSSTYIPKDSCPITCDDGKPCTRDYCSKETLYKCVHLEISPCCGNGVCESTETFFCADCKSKVGPIQE